MQDEFTRAKHYIELAKMMRRVGHDEPDVTARTSCSISRGSTTAWLRS
jgi:hypothetical protein